LPFARVHHAFESLMLKRLFVGLLLGLFLGSAMAAVATQVLHIDFAGAGAVLAYLFAAATGALLGLVAGKPIWSQTGKIEAGLKSFFGALISLGLMFALRRWVHFDIDLASIKAGAGPVGDLPATTLPPIAALLGAFFELDNTPESDKDEKSGGAKETDKKVRVAASGKKAALVDDLEDEEPVAKKKSRS